MTTQSIREPERTTEPKARPIRLGTRVTLRGLSDARTLARAHRIQVLPDHADPQIHEEIEAFSANGKDPRAEPCARRVVLVVDRSLVPERAHPTQPTVIQLQAKRKFGSPREVGSERVARAPMLFVRSVIETRTEPRVETKTRFERDRQRAEVASEIRGWLGLARRRIFAHGLRLLRANLSR